MAKKPKLPPIRARLKWVYDQNAERNPFVWLYTYWVIRDLRRYDGQQTIAPFTSYLSYTQSQLVPEMTQRDPTDLGRAMQAAGVERFSPPMSATVADVWRYVERFALVDVLTAEWSETRRWACAKVIPAVAGWVKEIVNRDGAGARLAMQWNFPWYGTVTHAELGDEARRELTSLVMQMPTICDWYSGASPNLALYKTWLAAAQAAEQWHRGLVVTGASGLEVGPKVFEWPDGWTVQELTNWEMFREEGRSLGHCLANSRHYYDDAAAGESVFLSLRTPGNTPWLTFEVNGPRMGWTHPASRRGVPVGGGAAQVGQIKGCKNRQPGTSAHSRDCPDPDPSECARVFDFLQHLEWTVGPDYQPCWVTAVRQLGLSNERRDPAPFPAGKLLRVELPGFQPGKPTERLKKIERWWE